MRAVPAPRDQPVFRPSNEQHPFSTAWIVEQVGAFLSTIKQRGTSVLLVEQKLAIALDISERVYVVGHGHVVFEGAPKDLRANDAVRKEWLEV